MTNTNHFNNNKDTVLMIEEVVDKSTSIEILDLSIRSHSILKRAGIDTIYDLMNLSTLELRSLKGMNKRSFSEILSKLSLIKKFDFE